MLQWKRFLQMQTSTAAFSMFSILKYKTGEVLGEAKNGILLINSGAGANLKCKPNQKYPQQYITSHHVLSTI